MTDQPAEPQAPQITITQGNPTDEEIAAVVAVITARSVAPTAADAAPRSGWAAYWRAVRAPLPPGPGSWQAAYRR
ncbi:acyl-CoA carboxylase subunit epsilon [Microlunatus soli]|uniref:Acyl-CoA carboxylase epsilon subunit n=1 Tax=Microlunatus soli TaxID=630515 RepID=A0A1H1X9U5_9ACTN|nr:acyl-CoA carboxylase subunit epsilon [Microlunatus soli]SDT06087.1 Acyl-CoA carboxylase epsilon subunit [Microlunatus soli]